MDEKTTPIPSNSPVPLDSRVTESPAPSAASDFSQILEALEDVKAVVGDVSSTIINRFAAFYNDNYTGGLNPPDYIIWRNSDSDYYMLVLTDSTYSNGQVIGNADLVNYHLYTGYNTMPSISVTTVSNRYIDIPSSGSQGSAYVYSSLQGYLPAPSIDTNARFMVVFSVSFLILFLVCVIAIFIKGVFFSHEK